jgi:acyl carrier protein
VRNELVTFIVDNFLFGRDSIEFSDDDSFIEKGLIDSSGVLELVGFLEDTYHIKVRDNELVPENLDSINKLLRYLHRKFAENAPEERSEGDLARRAVP